MTARSSKDVKAQDKSQCYERLRARVIDKGDAAFGSTSALVLVRQGMSAWMQLDDKHDSHSLDDFVAEHHSVLPAAAKSELLTVLTNLVFTVNEKKESA